MKGATIEETGDKRFIRMANQFVNIDELHIDLIDRINPFQKAFEILSKTVNANVLKSIMDCIDAGRLQMTEEEAILLWPKIKQFVKAYNRDPTYLMAPVHIVETFECFNLNPQKLELLLHKFFGTVCLEVDVFDNAGKRHTPREWFIAPLPIIEEVIELIISGEIINYVYDDEVKLMRLK